MTTETQRSALDALKWFQELIQSAYLANVYNTEPHECKMRWYIERLLEANVKALTTPAVAELTMDEADALFKEMIEGYNQYCFENDNLFLDGAEKAAVRCFFDFIEQKGYFSKSKTAQQTGDRAKALKEMPSPKTQKSLAPEWYVKHYATIKQALKAATAPNACADKGE